MLSKTGSLFGLALLLCLCSAVPARADLIIVATGVPSPNTLVDFSQFHGDWQITSGPIQVGGNVGEDIVWTSTNARSLVGDGPDIYGFSHPGGNGYWNSGRQGFTGLNTTVGTMYFRFNSGPVNAVGGFINYSTNFPFETPPNVIISALDINGNVLESYDINLLAPINTPDQVNSGAFRGILRSNADIFGFTVSNRYVALDDLTFSRAASVPEPATILLLGSGLLGVATGAVRRRRKRSDM